MLKIEMLLASIFLFIGMLQAQTNQLNLVSTASGYFQSNNETLTWALGEVLTETFSTDNLYLTQGFLQPYSVDVSIKNGSKHTNIAELYPNPACNWFIIDLTDFDEVQNKNPIPIQLEIFDMNGSKIFTDNLYSSVSKIEFDRFYSGVYLIVLSNSKKSYKQTFVLQKIDK